MAESKKFVPLKVAEPEYVNTNNPLRYLSVHQISMMLDSARSGRISQLQLLYALVEQCQLTLSMCITRRQSALPDWAIKRRDTRRYRSFDEKLAQEQEAFLNDMFIRCEDSGTLLRAIDTLHMAVFRGIGVIEPIYDEYGLQKIFSLDPWNFAIDYTHHDEFGQFPLYWNPSGADVLDFKTELELIPEEQIVANFSSSPIDSFGLQIFLAEQMGLESYSKLIARKGLPATYIVAPEDLPSENLETWAQRAVDCARGGSGAFPFGTNVITEKIDSTNGQSIQDFLEYMAKQIVLASTGGTLTSLAQATGLGSNIADVQQDVFKTIVRHDAYKIGDLINRGIAKKLLNWMFPNKPHLVYFDLSNEAKQNPEKYLQDAVSAKSAGLAIDMNQLEELTGYKLTKEEPKPDTSIWNVPRVNKEEWKPEAPLDAPQALVTGGEAVEVVNNTQEQTEGTTSASGDDRDVKHGVSILKAFNKVLQPIRELFYKLFDAKTRDESRQIAEEIDAKIKEIEESDDNELVKAVTQLMVDGFEDEGDKQEDRWSWEDAPEVIANSECHVTDHLCRIHDAAKIEALKQKTPEAMAADGRKALTQMLQDHKPVVDAFWRESLGPLDLEWGETGTAAKDYEDGWGIAKISKKHSDALMRLPEVISHGEIRKHPFRDDRVVIIQRNTLAVFQKDDNGHFLFTGMTGDVHRYARSMRHGELLETSR